MGIILLCGVLYDVNDRDERALSTFKLAAVIAITTLIFGVLELVVLFW